MAFPPNPIDPAMCPEQFPPHLLYAYVPDGTLTDDPADGGVSLYGNGLRLKLYNNGMRMSRNNIDPKWIPAPFIQHEPNKEPEHASLDRQ